MTDRGSHERDGTQGGKAELLSAINLLVKFAENSRVGDLRHSLAGLSKKLSSNCFNLAVLGQMKRGKSSVINALMGAEILPTGILPLTSVITRIRFGPKPAAYIHYSSGDTEPIEISALHEYITETANPGNRKQVAAAEVTYPSSFLGMGIDLIDTPGIGSTHLHNTSTTENYLGEVDAGIVVLSVDPPITAVESDFLQQIRRDIPRLLFVINKTDTASRPEVESVLCFLDNELRNRLNFQCPELFPLSARLALHEQGASNGTVGSSGIEQLAERLHYFASNEKKQVLLQSVALDVLRISRNLRFAASAGERAKAMRSDELDSKKRALEAAIARTKQEMQDLRHLLRQDVASIVARIEADLRNHVETAAPEVRRRLANFAKEHPGETRERLGALLDTFMRTEIERVFEDWRTQEDERARQYLAGLSVRFVERTNQVLERLQKTAGDLFEVPLSHMEFKSSLSVESQLYYHTDRVFQFNLDRLIFVLPKFLLRRIVFRRMLTFIDRELDKNSGRLRYDYLQRLEHSVAIFEADLKAPVAILIDYLSRILEPGSSTADSARSAIAQLDSVIAMCSSIIAEPFHAGESIGAVAD